MLRSIFSLIQNIITDSDREYKNTKSSTVFYLMSNPDKTLNVDLEIDGKDRETIKMIQDKRELPEPSNSFTITTEQGDAVTCTHNSDKTIRPKSKMKGSKEEKKSKEECRDVEDEEYIGDRASFSNDEDDKEEKYAEIQGEVGMNVRELLATLPQKKATAPEKDKEQLGALLEQIQKMKKGMERLHQIAKQFTCSDKFKQDVDFLIKNLSMGKDEDKQKNLAPTKP